MNNSFIKAKKRALLGSYPEGVVAPLQKLSRILLTLGILLQMMSFVD